jgi:DNA-binding transcriptional ArsR family regulator
MNNTRANAKPDFAALQKQAERATGLLKVLANESRLRVLCELLEGEKPVGEIEDSVGLRQSALSQHLAVLRHEKLVSTRRQGQFIYYALASDEAREIISTLFRIYCSPRKKKLAAP